MDLYIGNATRQELDFAYRIEVPGMPFPALRSLKLSPGTQGKISKLSQSAIDAIIAQQAKYGLTHESTIDHAKEFRGTCYSVDKPISAMRLGYLMEANLNALIVQGKEIRQLHAVAQNKVIEDALEQSGRPEKVGKLEVTFQEENHDPNNSVPQFSEGIVVSQKSEVLNNPGQSVAKSKARRRAA